MSWEYSDFSKEAKKHGGPNQYIQEIRIKERNDTIKDIIKTIIKYGIFGLLRNLTNNSK